MTISTILLIFTLGYALGFFFSSKNSVEIHLKKEDLEKILDTTKTEEERERAAEKKKQTLLHLVEEQLEEQTKEGPYKFYYVNLPVVTFSDSPENAYRTVLRSLKKRRGLRFKHNVIDEKEVLVRGLSVKEASEIFQNNTTTKYE